MQANNRSSTTQRFKVWAPEKETMNLHIVQPFDRVLPMQKEADGYFSVDVEPPGALVYFYQPNGEKDYPDPASPFQPQGVHGPSQTVDHSAFRWNDSDWKGLPLEEMIIYELHVGSFTPDGNFEAIIPRLDALKETGINTLELMPVAQFPGGRNWGYDGVFPYAVQNTYGGPEGLKKLVDACHIRGMAVLLDVVYNHLGPEGNYLPQFGPYFTPNYHTPWGDAINFDGEWSDGVRDFFSDNAVYWMEQYHVDGLRCDAVHAAVDKGAVHFWELTSAKVRALEQRLGKRFYLMAESDLNSPKVVKAPAEGGWGFDAQWLDDFHHALYVLLNPADRDRYYDFGSMQQVAKAYTEGFVHSGEWVKFRKRKHGASSAGVPGQKFVAFNLNHDQVGNRAGGERLCMLVDVERTKLAAAALLLAPYIPLLFMGEEWGDKTPFFYFVSHSDEALIRAVQKGRREEFRDFGFDAEIPDPQSEETFNRSKIDWTKRTEGEHGMLLRWHKALIDLRRTAAPLKNFDKQSVSVEIIGEKAFVLVRRSANEKELLLCLFNLDDAIVSYKLPDWFAKGRKVIDSKDDQWQTGGENQGHSALVTGGTSLQLAPSAVVVYAGEVI